MILNTLDHLGKFDAKGDDGYFVGYSLSSKAFRVFNKRTKKIEENLHMDFLENKSIKKGTGPDWLFDIDTLTNSMNYVPVVVAGTSSSNISGTKEDVHQVVKEKESPLRFIALLYWFHEAQMATSNATATKDDIIPSHKMKSKHSTSKYASTRLRKRSAGVPVTYHNNGPPSHECRNCHATMWYKERRKVKDGCEPNLLTLVTRRKSTRQYNAPTVSEVAAVIINDFGKGLPTRDVIVHSKDSGPRRVLKLHPLYMSLQYPLLFPYGEDGFHEEIPYNNNTGTRKTKWGYVTMKEYYSYIIQQRTNQGAAEMDKEYQDMLRVDLYHNLCDAVTQRDTNAEGLGKRIVPPRTFTRSPRYMMQNYQDAMAICRGYGNPYLFITFTSNPKWPEIADMLNYFLGQKAHDRPEVGTRVFKIKLTELLDDLTKKYVFEESRAETFLDEEGYPYYRRRDNKVTVKKRKFTYNKKNVGVQGFEELMTHNNRICLTFKEACFTYGLINDDMEWTKAISEASLWALGPQLRDIFVTMLLFCDVRRPLKLWEETWQILSKDILHKKRIASLLLPAGRTTHSKFVIPLDLMENSTCARAQVGVGLKDCYLADVEEKE
nr:hypothetical protein CTI12_AA123990 [Tanacetum cinerariifolium]